MRAAATASGGRGRQRDEGRLTMEYRQLGRSGLRVSALTLGTMTFGGRGGFRAVGATDVTARAGRSTCAWTRA